MKFNRASGVILHPTSLPGPDGIGDLGPEAYRWIDHLAETGCSLWQILPLGPTGYGDSPYQCFSAFAGNPYLISPTLLFYDDLLTTDDLKKRPEFPEDHVDYGPVIQWKLSLLDLAYVRFKKAGTQTQLDEFDGFKTEEASWLDDFSLFMAIKEVHGGVSWDHWPVGLRKRDAKSIDQFILKYKDDIERHAFRQYLFFKQWMALKDYCLFKGILIIGDVPIFVAYDCADVWANTDLFYLKPSGLPTVVAGVPPDYFSPTGQLWGNPLYRWDAHASSGYAWWISRLKSNLRLMDVLRLDHFRGFAGYWEVPYGKPTAEKGRWVQGPGINFFNATSEAIPGMPIIAEDLGIITADVIEMREKFCFPGMKVLHFAFLPEGNEPFLPHNFPRNCVAYTGTHDNDTAWGWYLNSSPYEQDYFRRYLAVPGTDVAWDMIRAVWSSVASYALTPMQDILNLRSEARMNFPSVASGNWGWRMKNDAFSPGYIDRLKEFNKLYERFGDSSFDRDKNADIIPVLTYHSSDDAHPPSVTARKAGYPNPE